MTEEHHAADGRATDAPPTRTPFAIPHRSVTDRKIAGVAGGIGRALNIDPVLIRVLFVVLAIFGASGVLLYCLAWLFMAADGDEVSAVESLTGRGKSSVSPTLAVVLIIVGVTSAGSVFSWGIGFWPVAIAALIVFALLVHRRTDQGRNPEWTARADDLAARIGEWGEKVGQQAGDWGERVGQRAGDWGSKVGDQMTDWASRSRSYDSPTGPAESATAADTATAEDSGGIADTGTVGSVDLPGDGRTPPAWDPLGAAPFAWDLPEPTASSSLDADDGDRRPRVSQLVLGVTLIVGATLSALTATGNLSLSWAAVAGLTLAVLALGLAVASVLPVHHHGLIGPGIFLAVVTLALSVTGLTGTAGFGQRTWSPTAVDQVAGSYTWNAGQSTLDLSNLVIPEGEDVSTTVTVNAGQATVVLPTGTSVTATCESRLGSIDCLGTHASGVRPVHTVSLAGAGNRGHLNLTVTTNAGMAEVRHGS